jgi:hypothetical protein
MKGDLLIADPAMSTRTPEKKSRITSTLAKFQLPKALYIVVLLVTIVAPRPTPNIPLLSAILSRDSAVDKTGTKNICVLSVPYNIVSLNMHYLEVLNFKLEG